LSFVACDLDFGDIIVVVFFEPFTVVDENGCEN